MGQPDPTPPGNPRATVERGTVRASGSFVASHGDEGSARAIDAPSERPCDSAVHPCPRDRPAARRPLRAPAVVGPFVLALLVTAPAEAAEPPPTPPPALIRIDDARAFTCGPRNLNVEGDDLQSAATVRLTKAGEADIVASQVILNNLDDSSHAGSHLLSCRFFDLSPGTAAGLWSVVVTNPDGQADTLVDVLEIVADCPRGAVGDLYVASSALGNILQFDGMTGDFVCIFADIPPGLLEGEFSPTDLAWAPNGNLWVPAVDQQSSPSRSMVAEFDGQSGAFLGWILAPAADVTGESISFGGPAGNLYLPEYWPLWGAELREYDRMTHAFLGIALSPSPPMQQPKYVRFASNGNCLVLGDSVAAGAIPVFSEYDGTTFAHVRDIAL